MLRPRLESEFNGVRQSDDAQSYARSKGKN
jgi:hypothetical protein